MPCPALPLPAAIRADLLLNACDAPVSFDPPTSTASGYPLLSTQRAVGGSDILWPDPLDLTFTLPPPHSYPKWRQVRGRKGGWEGWTGGQKEGGRDGDEESCQLKTACMESDSFSYLSW